MLNTGKWIWINSKTEENTYGEFYSEFSSRGECYIELSCDGDYTLFINGKYVASNQYGDFEHYKSCDKIDISPFTVNGKNHLAIVVWHFGKDTQRYKKYSPGLIFEIWENGKAILSSGENILSRKSKAFTNNLQKQLSPQLGFSYEYDSTKEDCWKTGGGADFEKSVLVCKNCSFVPRPCKKLELLPFVCAKEIAKGEGYILYDLGKEYVGLIDFELRANSESKINIAYGECLENGRVKRLIGNRDFSVDFVAKSGDNAHTSYMLRFACRYLEVSSSAHIEIDRIGIIPQAYPVAVRDIKFSMNVDREIYGICVNTLKLCMMEHYVDCPWREQCLYAFDSRNQMLCGYYAFEEGNFEYAKSNLILMSKDKGQDGLMSICYPCGIDLTIPSFSLHYVTSVLEYITHSGDTCIFDTVDSKLREIIDTFLGNIKNGLVCAFEGDNHWNFYDWSDHLDGRLVKGCPDALINMLTIIAVDNYERICALCDREFIYKNVTDELRKNTKEAFFQKEQGVFLIQQNIKPLELVNSLAVLARLTTEQEAKVICEKLSSMELSPSSLSTRCFKYDALLKTDFDKYRSFVIDDIRRTYQPMIKTGTVWETVKGDSDFDNAGSLCHGWSSMPVYYYHKIFNHNASLPQ